MRFFKFSFIVVTVFCLTAMFIGCDEERSETVTYVVSFNSQGAGDIEDTIVNEGSNVIEPSTPVRVHYIFGGWFTNSACTDSGRWLFYSHTVTDDITLYAKWTESPTYKVNYISNGSTSGEVPIDTLEYYNGDNFIILGKNTLTKNVNGVEFAFLGWHQNENVTSSISGSFYQADTTMTMGEHPLPLNEDLVLYAQWSAVKQIGPSGGIIFYDKGEYTDGWRFMEAAPSSTEWENIEWGYCDFDNPMPSVTTTGIGTGLENTVNIVDLHNTIDYYNTFNSEYPNYANGTVAAKLCYDLVVINNSITYDDWFLPSYEEMITMRYIKTEGGFGTTYDDGFYWSSTEWIEEWMEDSEICNSAKGYYFGNSSGSFGNKREKRRVRAVRKF